MVTHSSILAWRIPWTEEPGWGYSPWGHKELDITEYTHTHTQGTIRRSRLGDHSVVSASAFQVPGHHS